MVTLPVAEPTSKIVAESGRSVISIQRDRPAQAPWRLAMILVMQYAESEKFRSPG